MSHDLRNPLTIAQGRTELAIEEADTTHLEEVVNALDRMESLIENLLALAHDDATPTQSTWIHRSELFEACWQNVETSNAELVTDTETVIKGDQSRLQQLGENLIRNAVEHGGDAVTIRIGDLPDGSGFYVEDDGPGIPETMAAAIFDHGYSESEAGHGVGLSIVKRIADAHGWDISVSTSKDGGARFEFTWTEAN